MVSAVAIAAARRREQEAVERQEAALGIRLEQPQNPPGNIIAGNIIAGAGAAIDDQDIFDSPNAAAAAAIEGDSILAAANLIFEEKRTLTRLHCQPPATSSLSLAAKSREGEVSRLT
jgi:hypothetical protein